MERALRDLLVQHQQTLATAWFEKMLASYPEESRRHFKEVNRMFTNPVGYNLEHSLSEILKELLKEAPESEVINDHLQMILRIKATQEVLPSQAVSFIPAFKQILQEVVGLAVIKEKAGLAALLDFYEDLDTVGLYAFDIYVESRELLFKLRLAQIKETNDVLMRANLLNEEVDMSTFMRCSTQLLNEGDCTGCPSGCPSEGVVKDMDKGV